MPTFFGTEASCPRDHFQHGDAPPHPWGRFQHGDDPPCPLDSYRHGYDPPTLLNFLQLLIPKIPEDVAGSHARVFYIHSPVFGLRKKSTGEF